MHFDESYFQGEEREGFFVEEMMKRAWAAQMEVLKEIERICKKHHLTYFAGYGTLLGAVRHKGFIPWDDDMDLYMLRDDYEKFMGIVQQEMPKAYRLYNMYTDENWDEVLSRVVNGTRINFSDDYLKQYHGCPYVVGIDIFPLDFISQKEEEKKLQYDLYTLIMTTKYKVTDGQENMDSNLAQIEELCQVKLKRDVSLRRQLIVLADRISSLYHREECEEVTLIHSNINGYMGIMKKEWFQDVIWIPFEITEIAVPKNYDACLKAVYGPDYMMPVQYTGHDYPFYKKQERMLQAALEQKKKADHAQS